MRDLLFYDCTFYEPRIKINLKLQNDIIDFVSKYGLLGFLSEHRKLETTFVPDKFYEMMWKNMEKEGFPPEYIADRKSKGQFVKTFLSKAEQLLKDIIECNQFSGFAVDTDNIKTPATFRYRQGYYDLKDRRWRKGKWKRFASAKFNYHYEYENKEYTPLFATQMPANEYIDLFFPTHVEIVSYLEGLQCNGLYSEPLSLFLYAAKVFYLNFMYTRQMFAQWRKSVKPEDAGYTAEPHEEFLHLKLNETAHDFDINRYPTYDTLLHLALNDIVNKKHSTIICPWCGKVKLKTGGDRKIMSVYCEPYCEERAKSKRNYISKDKPVKIENYYNVKFRPALKNEVQALIEFYHKHTANPITSMVEEEILSYQSEKHKADLFVAEFKNHIICLAIKEPDIIEDSIRSAAYSIIKNKKYEYTNADVLILKYIRKYQYTETP